MIVNKFSGYKFFKKFKSYLKKNPTSIFLIDPNLKLSKNNRILIKNLGFKNQSINLKGKDTMRVYDLLKVLSEILGYKEEEIEFKTYEHPDHYVRTPYSYEPKLGRNYTPNLNIDMGQGLLELIQEVQKKFL